MLDHEAIAYSINAKLHKIGIDPEVNGQPSHTAELVSLIVREIVRAIKRDAEVKVNVSTIVNTSGISSTPGTPEIHQGTGSGAGFGKVI